jgi:hypothetical protein
MTHTIGLLAARADVGKRVGERVRSSSRTAEISLDEAEGPVASDAALADLEAEAAAVTRVDPADPSAPRGGTALRRNRPLLATIAGVAAGVLVGLGRRSLASRAQNEVGVASGSEP